LVLLGSLPLAGAPAFTDVARQVGLIYDQYASLQIQTNSTSVDQLDPFHMTGGVAAIDYDNDGWTDLFVTRMDAQPILFHNKGGVFEAIPAETLGIWLPSGSNGAAWADINNDGYPDLYITTVGNGRNYLFLNQGGHFTEAAAERGIAVSSDPPRSGFGAAFGDYDRDGYLDLFTTGWTDLNGVANRLFHNVGAQQPGFFTDATESAGVLMCDPNAPDNAHRRTYGFAPRFCDMDGDGWPDLLVVADFGTSRLFWNMTDGTFLDGTRRGDVGTEPDGMGSTVGDFDGDGLPDWFVTSIYNAEVGPFTGNRLYRNLGARHFEDVTDQAGVRNGGWGWGTSFFDYDNDGNLDLIMTNGMDVPNDTGLFPFLQDPMRLWHNTGQRTFNEVSAQEGITDTAMGRGLAVLDFNNDGLLDVFVVNTAGQPVLYQNNLHNGNHWLRVKLRGRHSNRDGIGARLTLIPDLGNPQAGVQIREIDGGSNFLGQNERTAHFGLGPNRQSVDRIVVRWPSGMAQKVDHVAVDATIEIIEASDYSQWVGLHFNPAQAADPLVTGPFADPDHDGTPNIAEYAFGRNPQEADSGGVLEWSLSSNGIGWLLNLAFAVDPGAVEASVRLESRAEIFGNDSWIPLQPAATSLTSGFSRRSIQLPAGSQQQFFRLVVEPSARFGR
jgi:hypothetical protein